MSGLFSCITDSVSLLWNVPLSVRSPRPSAWPPSRRAQVFEGDSQADAAGVYRRAHIVSSASGVQLPNAGDSTIAPILMPRMLPTAAPAVPELTIRCGCCCAAASRTPRRRTALRRGSVSRLCARSTPRRARARRVVDGLTKVVQVAARVPNRLAGSELEVRADARYGGAPAQPARSAASYPSLLLAEREEEERQRAVDHRSAAADAKARSAAISSAVAAGIRGGGVPRSGSGAALADTRRAPAAAPARK